MHVVMYSIQSSFCTECPLPSSSDTDLICAGDFVQPLASLLCLGGAEVSAPKEGLEDWESSLVAKHQNEGFTRGFDAHEEMLNQRPVNLPGNDD